MTTTTPLLDPRVIALAHYAGRALLENVLARHGATFQQSVTLRLAAVAEGPVERDAVVGASPAPSRSTPRRHTPSSTG